MFTTLAMVAWILTSMWVSVPVETVPFNLDSGVNLIPVDTCTSPVDYPSSPEKRSLPPMEEESSVVGLAEVAVRNSSFCEKIVEDMFEEVQDRDHNYSSVLCNFISSNAKIKNRSHAPTSSIAYHLTSRPQVVKTVRSRIPVVPA